MFKRVRKGRMEDKRSRGRPRIGIIYDISEGTFHA